MKTTVAAIVVGLILIWTTSFLAYRLLPETSPLARAGDYIRDNNCVDCHTAKKNIVFNNNTKSASSHPTYTMNSDELIDYFVAVRINLSYEDRQKKYSNTLMRGEHLARKHYCFACHGLFGQGGNKNSGSLKGYIPGWFGRDFDILTNNGDAKAVREWIQNGMYNKVINEPILGSIARHYIEQQEFQMLELSTMPENELKLLVSYVLAIRSYGAMDQQALLQYENETMQ